MNRIGANQVKLRKNWVEFSENTTNYKIKSFVFLGTWIEVNYRVWSKENDNRIDWNWVIQVNQDRLKKKNVSQSIKLFLIAAKSS